MPAIFAQVRYYTVCPRRFSDYRRECRFRLLPASYLPDRGNVVNIYAQFHANS
jgi:hypothetical protein